MPMNIPPPKDFPILLYPNQVGDEMYQDASPLVEMYGDPDGALWVYLHALGYMLKDIDDAAKDGDNGEPGWSQIMDINRAKTKWLPWLGQMVGYKVPVKPSDQSTFAYDKLQRERIISRSAHRRGSTEILREIVHENLYPGTPIERVIIQERYSNQSWAIRIWVENEDIATSKEEILRAAKAQKAAGLIMDVGFMGGASYDVFLANHTSYQQVKDFYANLSEITTNPSGV